MNTSLINYLLENKLFTRNHYPPKKEIENWLDKLFDFLFLSHQKQSDEQTIQRDYLDIKIHLNNLLDTLLAHGFGVEYTNLFMDNLHFIYENILEDAHTFLQFDPAAKSLEEVVFAYPGFYAIFTYRIAHSLHRLGILFLPRILSEYAHQKTGIDIHPAAVIGSHFMIDHGTGVVIGETTIIGNYVKIYQGVTLGALQVAKELARTKRHPTIEDEVIIYSGSTILGGNTVIGKRTTIGGNVWLTHSVPSDSLVLNKSEIRMKNSEKTIDVDDYCI